MTGRDGPRRAVTGRDRGDTDQPHPAALGVSSRSRRSRQCRCQRAHRSAAACRARGARPRLSRHPGPQDEPDHRVGPAPSTGSTSSPRPPSGRSTARARRCRSSAVAASLFSVRSGVMRRPVLSESVVAWCEGRAGRPRRPHVEECLAVTAEDAYDALLRDARRSLHPGSTGELRWVIHGRAREVAWEVRANRLWRGGRLFLTCAVCARRATRIYRPTPDAPAACRLCWQLSFASQQLNYRDGGALAAVGITLREFALQQTRLRRRSARAAARARWAARRTLWTPA